MEHIENDFLQVPTCGETHFEEVHDKRLYRPQGLYRHTLQWTLQGEAIIGDRAEGLRCTRGDLVLFPPSVPHLIETPSNWVHRWVYFDAKPEHGLHEWAREGPGVLVQRWEDPDHCAFIDRCFESFLFHQSRHHQRRESLLSLGIDELMQTLRPQPHRSDPRFEALRQRLLKALHEPWTVTNMAREVHLSPSRFAHRFQELEGLSPMTWLNRQRLEKSREMILLTDRPLALIAESCGFNSPLYFSTAFRRHYGLPPSQLRRRHGDTHSPMVSRPLR